MSSDDMKQFPEAPVSNTFKVRSTNGFEHLFTMREVSVKDLITKIETVEKALLDKGWTPLEQKSFSKFPPKQVDYAEGTCPKCGSRLVNASTKDGRKFVKCETNKWNFAEKKAEGCDFTRWPEMTQADL